ncbi:MAG: hypothetical protein HZC36_14150 [Armatimonadetes bacterium]|nr:hypothetical protein [Armatimonadota bacterium]
MTRTTSGTLSGVFRAAKLALPALASLFALLLPGQVAAQARSGSYTPAGAAPVSWSINPNHALIWDGKPYLPCGVRIPGSVEAVARAKAAGVADVIVELPASGMGWQPVLDKLEAEGMRYLIAINSLAAPATGIAVEPQAYRITGITKKTHLERSIPGATSALVLFVTRVDGTIRQTKRVQIENGKLSLDVDPISSLEHVVLVYPEMASLAQLDCWAGLDAHRDTLLLTLKRHKLGPGLRGILNPVGASPRLRTPQSFVPTDPVFRNEFQSYLASRYSGALETLQRTWGLKAANLNSFEQAARLVPLWAGTRGVPMVFDPSTGMTYQVDMPTSKIWSDIETVITQAEARRFRRLAGSLKQVCDVPIVQEWMGWNAPYENGTAALDGLAAATSGTTPSEVSNSAARCASSVFRWKDSGWLIAGSIDLGLGEGLDAKLNPVLEDLTAMGYRGWFVKADDAKLLMAVGQEAPKRGADVTAANWTVQPVFFPESALNPANTMALPGFKWWLPSPDDGNRVELGERISCYRIGQGGASTFVLWSKAQPMRVKLLFTDPKKPLFSSLDGSDPKPKLVKGGVEVDLSTLPLIITNTEEIPIPETCVKEVSWQFDQLLKEAEGLRIDTNDMRFLYITSLDGLERSPGGNFVQMRQIVDKLSQRLAPFVWLEAENVGETNFSEILKAPGVSNGSVLGLRTALSAGSSGFDAEYRFLPRSEAETEVWIAARIPAEARGAVQIRVAGQTLRIEEGPLSLYGPGFGWYRVGSTRLARGESKLIVHIDGGDGVEFAIDAIVLAPGHFTPNGIKAPTSYIYTGSNEKGKG